jgi:hypothetical protein
MLLARVANWGPSVVLACESLLKMSAVMTRLSPQHPTADDHWVQTNEMCANNWGKGANTYITSNSRTPGSPGASRSADCWSRVSPWQSGPAVKSIYRFWLFLRRVHDHRKRNENQYGTGWKCEIKLNWQHQNLDADPIACLIVVALSVAAQWIAVKRQTSVNIEKMN